MRRLGIPLLGAWLASTIGLGSTMTPDVFDVPLSLLPSPTGGSSNPGHSAGTRARRRWKRTRSAGLTKRVRA